MKAKGIQHILRCIAVVTASLILISAAHAASKFKVLHYFGKSPAANPAGGLVADSAGNLYGMTFWNRRRDFGVVYKLAPASGGTWSYSVLHAFDGSQGQQEPSGGVLLDSSGNLYGTIRYGGPLALGTVFELSPSGKGWQAEVLHNFGASGDVGEPTGALTMDKAGNLYGKGPLGGAYTHGGVFQLKRSGNTWQETVIHSFNGSDGDSPVGDLAWDSAGNLYGTTVLGGAAGSGVVYQLTPVSGGDWTETVLYSFAATHVEADPTAGVVIDTAGNLYGASGGTNSCQAGCGTVYRLRSSMGHWTHTVLHTFKGPDGQQPVGVVLDSASNLYGTTVAGGRMNQGIVFKLSQSGNTWTETILHSFDQRHGAQPIGGLIFDQQGVLYGTTFYGGLGKNPGYGVVFSLTP
jgi:uncharacterized repeat protein (TIGR03803 family)